MLPFRNTYQRNFPAAGSTPSANRSDTTSGISHLTEYGSAGIQSSTNSDSLTVSDQHSTYPDPTRHEIGPVSGRATELARPYQTYNEQRLPEYRRHGIESSGSFYQGQHGLGPMYAGDKIASTAEQSGINQSESKDDTPEPSQDNPQAPRHLRALFKCYAPDCDQNWGKFWTRRRAVGKHMARKHPGIKFELESVQEVTEEEKERLKS
ncbi:MAG: hypothetical protein Q9227_005152 [Pyrenula ochraceoflavens]